MKYIFLTIILLTIFCLGGKAATTYNVQGYTPYFDRAWQDRTPDKMANITGTNRYYLIKEWNIPADNTTTYFRIHRSKESEADGNRAQVWFSYDRVETSSTTNYTTYAPLTFTKAGDYWVIFTIDKADRNTFDFSTQLNQSNQSEMNSIQVVIIPKPSAPKLSADQGSSSLWPEQVMSFDNTDNKCHFNQEVSVSDAGYEGKFKVGVYHRTTADGGLVEYGTEGEAGGEYVSVLFPYACSYEMEFTFDPIWRTAPTVTVKGYQEYTIGATGYATYSFDKVLDVPSDVTAYYITGQNGQQFFSSGTTKIPKTTTSGEARTGVIIKGSAGTHRLYISDDQSTVTLPGNKLSGTGKDAYHVNANESYCFTVKDGQVGFYNSVEGTYAAYKAFLPASEVSSAREFFPISFDGENTLSVDAMSKQPTADAPTYYNLQGQPVAHPTKGLYIVDGRKVVVK